MLPLYSNHIQFGWGWKYTILGRVSPPHFQPASGPRSRSRKRLNFNEADEAEYWNVGVDSEWSGLFYFASPNTASSGTLLPVVTSPQVPNYDGMMQMTPPSTAMSALSPDGPCHTFELKRCSNACGSVGASLVRIWLRVKSSVGVEVVVKVGCW
jgi:hypothetical protein